MQRDQTLVILRTHLPELTQRFGVKQLALFGSVARDEARSDSDVDILVEFMPDARTGLFEFVELQEHLTSLLGCQVDLVVGPGTSGGHLERSRGYYGRDGLHSSGG